MVELAREFGQISIKHSQDEFIIRECISMPYFYEKCNTSYAKEWRIRNLGPSDGVSVELDDRREVLVVRTKSKKFYKEIDVKFLKVELGTLKGENVLFSFRNATTLQIMVL